MALLSFCLRYASIFEVAENHNFERHNEFASRIVSFSSHFSGLAGTFRGRKLELSAVGDEKKLERRMLTRRAMRRIRMR
jgi:hypothetical protein